MFHSFTKFVCSETPLNGEPPKKKTIDTEDGVKADVNEVAEELNKTVLKLYGLYKTAAGRQGVLPSMRIGSEASEDEKAEGTRQGANT